MIQYSFPTYKRQMIVNAYVVTKKPQKVCVVAFDKNKMFTEYLNHCGWVKEKDADGLYRRRFEIILPQSPNALKVIVYNQSVGKRKGDPSFKVEKFGVTKLKKWQIWLSPQTEQFVKFAQKFSENAGILRAWKKGDGDNVGVYKSDNGEFTIKYFDIIRSKENGKPLSTPARISNKTGIIEVAKHFYKDYSVAMRMMILLHEYAHFYLNKNMANEIQADLNGLYIYLGLGYSPIEAHRAFLYVFSKADSPANDMRYSMIKKYIMEFMDGKVAMPLQTNQKALRKAS